MRCPLWRGTGPQSPGPRCLSGTPTRVLVQGDAEAPDAVTTSLDGFEDELRKVLRRQPAGSLYSSNPLTRYVFDWYYMRLMIHVTPRRILWWPGGDFSRRPCEAYRVG